ncbi:hypothetical protein [Treponema endosymbiont of Eucomonympha sp.]|uniref:hypothetical protein n=1 Tax=Treponema endosymbiont of Eucomonympha sp. TaxID=1580831 RepID=UPI0013967660|nr:hypothetical protein [Treponema endosymbiont of Eucomonympha sp.]
MRGNKSPAPPVFRSKLRNISLKSSSPPSNTGEESLHATQSSLFSSALLFISGVFLYINLPVHTI